MVSRYNIKKRSLVLFIISTILAMTSMVSALEMSSKRDCVVCHIMWLDDFRTDQEVLVTFQPGNVLMADTQGVVSSEDICYSCHDGYVKESRNTAWNHNRHPVFVKPSENVTIPDDLPLSVKGELYCGTCHSAHGKGAAPHGDPLGRTAVYREVNIDSSLCEKCHRKEASFKFTNGHPLHTSAIKLPDRLFELGSTRATNKDKVICQSCHKMHGARGKRILIINNNNSELCLICHKNKETLVDTKHDLRTTLPDEKNIKHQSPSESGPCGACHIPHNAADKRLWARPATEGNPASRLCLSCHGEATGYKTKRIGEYSHPINVKPSAEMKPADRFPLFSEDGLRTSGGKIQCFTCHNVHQWDPASPINRGGREVEGDSSNSFLRISNDLSNLCLSCHTGKKQIITSDHNLTVTAPYEKNIQGFTPMASGPCEVCHIPHNAASRRLWSKKLNEKSDFVNQLCTVCHNSEGAAKAKLIGENYHIVNVKLDKYDMKTGLPLYDSQGRREPDGKIVCLTCHDPHTWNPDGPVLNYPYENIEGDAGNSFLRISASPSSGLCATCHEDKALVDGTDHDLDVTAPEAVNLLGRTVKESGPCGACHLVHNSPNKMRLWARQFGRIQPGEDIIDALCTSCHSKGNPGEDKIPLIATHPEEKLINNVLRSNRDAIDFSPIFDKKTGEEVNVGNISCPSCHNVHQWSPFIKQKGAGKKIEGTATNSFLRNVSYNNICIDCHGLDAIFRYKYFHDPEERVEPPSGRIELTD